MVGREFFRARRFLPTTRRERALAAKLDDAWTSLAPIAAVVRNLSAFEDAQAHLIVKAARDPESAPSQGIAATHTDSAVARSKRTAELLDRVTEALERLAASLRDT